MLRENFLPRLFFGKTKYLSPIVGDLSTMPVKKYRLGLMNPVKSVEKNYLSSQRGSTELIWAAMRGGPFSNANSLMELR